MPSAASSRSIFRAIPRCIRCAASPGRRTAAPIPTARPRFFTVLLYLNQEWSPDGGRLRILNSDNVEDYVKEVPPFAGTLLIFRRSDTSWHGHLPFEGQRRTIQLNWVTSQAVVDREQGRHAISTLVKKVTNLFQPAS